MRIHGFFAVLRDAGGSRNAAEMAKWRQIMYPLEVGALD
jgi:hypothetical protein